MNEANGSEAANVLYIEYINGTKSAADALGLNFFTDVAVPSHSTNYSLFDDYKDFATRAASVTLQIKISHGRKAKRYSVGLTDADKIKIRHFCDQIKGVIDAADIRVQKKDALYGKLNVFLAEVDKIRTALDTFSDRVIGLANIGGEVAKELEPARRWVDSIARLTATTATSRMRNANYPLLPSVLSRRG